MINICIIPLDNKDGYDLSLPCNKEQIRDILKQIGDRDTEIHGIVGIDSPEGLVINSSDSLYELNQGAKLIEQNDDKKTLFAYLEYKPCKLVDIKSVLEKMNTLYLFEDVYSIEKLFDCLSEKNQFDYLLGTHLFPDDFTSIQLKYLLTKEWISYQCSEYSFTSYGFLKIKN